MDPAAGSEIAVSDISEQAFDGISISLLVMTAIVVAVRLWNSWKGGKQFFADDYLSVIAFLFQIAAFVLYKYLLTVIMNPMEAFLPDTAVRSARIVVAQAFVAGTALWAAKVPILVLFARIFWVKTWVRVVAFTTVAATLIVFIGVLIPVGIQCSPDGKVLDLMYLGTCMPTTLRVGLAHGVTALVTDIIILIIPLPVIWGLQLSLTKKIGLGIVFLTGIFAIAASAVSLYYKARNFSGEVAPTITPLVATMIEVTIAIAVGCVPALRSFWSHHIVQLALYTQIRSAFSSILTTRTQKTDYNGGEYGSSKSGINTDRTVHQSHEYVDLEDTQRLKGSYMFEAGTPHSPQRFQSGENWR